jgi:FkbM family methyltransferase
LWSRVLAAHFKGTVVAFEPLPKHIECFRKNTEGLANVHLVPIALAEQYDDLLMDAVPDNSGNACVVNEKTHIGGNRIAVPVHAERLDSFKLAQLNKIDFIKIDCEGWELPIIKGAEKTIKNNKPIMVVEQKPNNGSRYGWDDTAAVDLLKSWGAKVLWVKADDYCLAW